MARASALHAEGHRFDSDILHRKQRKRRREREKEIIYKKSIIKEV